MSRLRQETNPEIQYMKADIKGMARQIQKLSEDIRSVKGNLAGLPRQLQFSGVKCIQI